MYYEIPWRNGDFVLGFLKDFFFFFFFFRVVGFLEMERFLVLAQSSRSILCTSIAKPRRTEASSRNSEARERIVGASSCGSRRRRRGSLNWQNPNYHLASCDDHHLAWCCECCCCSPKGFGGKRLLGLSEEACPTTSCRCGLDVLHNTTTTQEPRFVVGVKNSGLPRSKSYGGGMVYRMIRAGGFKNKLKKAVKKLEWQLEKSESLGELQGELPQLAISLPLGLASFEALFMVGWVSSLRGILPSSGAGGFFSAGDLILCSVMFANCVVGWYALEHSRSEIAGLPRDGWWRRVKAEQVGLWELGSSLALSFIPFANLFMWLRFAKQQEHLSARARAGIVANAWVYGGPPLFTILLLFSGGWSLWFQAGLVTNFALLMGALHRPFEEARVKNEKILMQVAKAKKTAGIDKKPRQAGGVEQKQQEISDEEKATIERMKELEEFDMLLAQSSNTTSTALPGMYSFTLQTCSHLNPSHLHDGICRILKPECRQA
jgi:hypothetical protein